MQLIEELQFKFRYASLLKFKKNERKQLICQGTVEFTAIRENGSKLRYLRFKNYKQTP